ncbi:MAG: glycerol kinase [Planctomycetota bacterium]|nr:MAG: glycerol kinase [Planctomycetota bacterium]
MILAIDQGTTSTRAILFDPDGRPRGRAQRELRQSFPAPGRVEHDPEEIWAATVEVCRGAVADAEVRPDQVAGIGITNQRETVVLWEREGGRPLHPALVWQDRRTADLCARLRADGAEELVRERTGLLLDPYFSATKLAWLLDELPGARAAAERGDLCAGTIDCFLLWRLTGGRVHATDASNASRTLLFDLRRQEWDPELLELFRIPAAVLPEVRDNAAEFGSADDLLDRPLPVAGMAGDQQAAAFGQACHAPGTIKSTYGTGCFVLLNTGGEPLRSSHRLLTTVAWRLAGETTYALEGSVFSAGATIQWLRDGLGLIEHAAETEALAAAADPAQRVHLVPAFTGLGAPWWDPHARGALLGLTRGCGRAEIARAALESVAWQTRDLMAAMAADGAAAPPSLRVDGGLSANDWAMQFLADALGLPVERPTVTETTALGAAALAGLQLGLFADPEEAARTWTLARRFRPEMPETEREERYRAWGEAVRRVLTAG